MLPPLLGYIDIQRPISKVLATLDRYVDRADRIESLRVGQGLLNDVTHVLDPSTLVGLKHLTLEHKNGTFEATPEVNRWIVAIDLGNLVCLDIYRLYLPVDVIITAKNITDLTIHGVSCTPDALCRVISNLVYLTNITLCMIRFPAGFSTTDIPQQPVEHHSVGSFKCHVIRYAIDASFLTLFKFPFLKHQYLKGYKVNVRALAYVIESNYNSRGLSSVHLFDVMDQSHVDLRLLLAHVDSVEILHIHNYLGSAHTLTSQLVKCMALDVERELLLNIRSIYMPNTNADEFSSWLADRNSTTVTKIERKRWSGAPTDDGSEPPLGMWGRFSR